MKRFLSILLALVLLSSIGCVTLADEQKTLSVMIYDRGNATATYGSATDNYWTRWIKANFGEPNGIAVEYIPVPRSEDAAKVNTMMAAGSAPDIIFSYDSNMIMGYGKDGGLVELSGLIDQYAPNIKEHLSDALVYGQADGNQWAIVAKRTNVGRYANFIRKDWLDQIGYTLEVNEDGYYHLSVDEFADLLRQFKTLDLDECGMEMFPLGMTGAWTGTLNRPIIYSFIDTAAMTPEIRACYNEMLWPGYKEGVRFLNTLYNEGLVDPDFMVDTDTSYPAFNAQISNGRTLAFGQDNWSPNGLKALYEANPNAEFVGFVLDNVNGEPFAEVYAPTGMYIAVPATCKYPEAAVMYLDFLANWDNAKVLYYGFEGVHYEMIDNAPTTIARTAEEKAAMDVDFERINTGDMTLVYNGAPFGYATSFAGKTDVEVRWGQLNDKLLALAKVGASGPYYFQGIKTDAQQKYDGFLTNPTNSLPLLISCAADEFDAKYDELIEEYLSSGGQDVLDAQVALFNELEAAK